MLELTYIAILMASMLGLLLSVRLTEHPFKIRASLAESSANTFTTLEVAMPIAPVVVGASKGREAKLQAIEIVKIASKVDSPSLEDDQSNTFRVHLTDSSQTAMIQMNDEDFVWGRDSQIIDILTTSGATSVHVEQVKFDDMTDGDGSGLIYTKRSIHLAVAGTGNASVRTAFVEIWAHLIELTGSEVIVNRALDD